MADTHALPELNHGFGGTVLATRDGRPTFPHPFPSAAEAAAEAEAEVRR